MYYEVKISCIINESGQSRKRTDTFIVKAYSVIEAVTEFEKQEYEVNAFMNVYDEWEVVSVKTTPYTDVVNYGNIPDGGGKFYRVKINQLTVNEATGKEKKVPQYILILASDIDDAKGIYEDFTKDWLDDIELESLSETKILDYFAHPINNQ